MRFIIFLLSLALAGCASRDKPNLDVVKIVCTTSIIADAISEITHDSTLVIALMGPGTDPHLFKPTKTSLDHMAQADIIFSNGLHLEGRMQEVLKNISRSKPVVMIGDTLPQIELRYGDAAQKMPDPHIWFDIQLWKQCIAYAHNQLKIHFPKTVNENKYNAYIHKLEELDNWVKAEINEIPKPQRVLITAHDAFSYFGDAYDIEVVGLQGISTMAEYGIRDITNMVNLISSKNIKAVFVESSVSSRSIDAVIAGCRERGLEITLGGTLYSDALGGKNSGAENYIDMVKTNVKTIKKALL